MKQTKKMISGLLASMMLSTQLFSIGNSVMAQAEPSVIQKMAQNEQSVQESIQEQNIPMEERVTRAELSIDEDKKTLSTILENKDVEMKIVLDTSSTKYALYQNPTFEIEMPSSIETVTLNDVKLLLEEELTIKKTQVITKNEKQVIHLELAGEQTEYFNDFKQNIDTKNVIAKGANIVVNMNVTVKKLTTTQVDTVTLYYTNQKNNLYEETKPVSNGVKQVMQSIGIAENKTQGMTTDVVFLVAPTGVTAATKIEGYDGNHVLENLENETKQVMLSAGDTVKNATITGTVFNNDENTMEKIQILGRIPSQDTTNFENMESFGSNFSFQLLSEMTVQGMEDNQVSIYYSENGAAGKDLNDVRNGWKQENVQLEKVKSYLLVFSNDVKLEQTQQITFSYTAQIPEKLTYHQKAVHSYQVSYQSEVQEAILKEVKTAGNIEFITGQSNEMAVTLEADAVNVRENQIVKMKVTVENKGEQDAKNVKIIVPPSEFTKFVKYVDGNGFEDFSEEQQKQNQTIEIEKVEAGKTVTKSYYVRIQDSIDEIMNAKEELTTAQTYPQSVKQKVFLSYDHVENQIPSNECTINIEKGTIQLDLYVEGKDEVTLRKGDILYFTLDVWNIAKLGDLKNAIVSIPLPEQLAYRDAKVITSWLDREVTTEGIQYQEQTRTIEVKFETLETAKYITFSTEVIGEEGTFTVKAMAKAENIEEQFSNSLEYSVEKTQVEVSELTSTPKYAKETEQITYLLKIKNTGNVDVSNFQIISDLPEGVIFEKATVKRSTRETTIGTAQDKKVTIPIVWLRVGETIEIRVIVKADFLPNKTEKQVQNKMIVTGKSINTIETNVVTNMIEYNSKAHEQIEKPNSVNPIIPNAVTDPSNQSQQTTYQIKGTAWVDANQNGKRESTEELLSNMKVLLIEKANNKLVKEEMTSEKGTYEFDDLEPNEYLVIFLYDVSKYSITEYQKENVDTSLNSDAINLKIKLDGETRYAGVANTIKVVDRSIRDIDIGLYEAKKFDLRLEKYISKITLTTPTIGTRVTTYDHSKLEKPEVLARNVGKSNVIVEYKIVVKNEGQIPGYATKIVDYLPEEMKFVSELNPSWYVSNNQRMVLNNQLAETKLEPGESKELVLVLSLAITEKNIGKTITNQAEIYESYNEQGLEDIDSTPGNKVEGEDDTSKADIVLSIVTGKIILYTTLTMIVILLLICGVVFIKKVLLTTKK